VGLTVVAISFISFFSPSYRHLLHQQPYSGAGILLTIIGFLGSFAQATTRSILAMTLGRLSDWVRKG
jgi:hypothetical protein